MPTKNIISSKTSKIANKRLAGEQKLREFIPVILAYINCKGRASSN